MPKVYSIDGIVPVVHPSAFVHESAVLVGERDGLVERSARLGTLFVDALSTRLRGHPLVRAIRGRGLFIGVELVQDRASKTPFDPASRLHARIKARAFANGLLCYPMGGTLDGVQGDHVLLAPPFILEEAQLEEMVSKLGTALDEVLKSAVAA